MPESEDLAAKLMATNSEIQLYVVELKEEIGRLQKRIVKLEVQIVSADKKLAAYERYVKEEEAKKKGPPAVNIILNQTTDAKTTDAKTLRG